MNNEHSKIEEAKSNVLAGHISAKTAAGNADEAEPLFIAQVDRLKTVQKLEKMMPKDD